MIGILILVGVFAWFYNSAKTHNKNSILWGILSIVTWFGSQMILGFIWGMLDPYVLSGGTGKIMIGGFVVSVISVAILHYALVANAKKNKTTVFSDEIMDDDSFEDL